MYCQDCGTYLKFNLSLNTSVCEECFRQSEVSSAEDTRQDPDTEADRFILAHPTGKTPAVYYDSTDDESHGF